MAKYRALTDKPHEVVQPTKGILITNLGTPDAPETSALRRYLAEFLSDPRVVEIPRLVWMIILHGIILRIRPAKSAKLYQSIWTDEGSPLMVYCKSLGDKLQAAIDHDEAFSASKVRVAMRYGNPSIASELRKFQDEGIHDITVLPLYPQYGAPTTGSTFDAIAKELTTWRWVPSLRFINAYHDNPLYIQALGDSIQRHIDSHGMPDVLVLSYHGMPKLFLDRGDPYYCMCMKTTRLVTEYLGVGSDTIVTTFQSRFGKAEWLKPYTDETLANLPKEGKKHIAIACPAFSVDCLETLEEIAEENKDVFIEAGGETYHYIPALNDDDAHVDVLKALIK